MTVGIVATVVVVFAVVVGVKVGAAGAFVGWVVVAGGSDGGGGGGAFVLATVDCILLLGNRMDRAESTSNLWSYSVRMYSIMYCHVNNNYT